MERQRVAITGQGIVCSAGRDVESFWKKLTSGETCIRPLPPRSALAESARGGIAGSVSDEHLDEGWARFTELVGQPGLEAGRVERMAGAAIAEALVESRVDLGSADRSRIGFVAGRCNYDDGDPYEFIGSPFDVLADLLGVEGARLTISTACTASSNAIGISRDLIASGEFDVVIAGGADVLCASTFRGFHAMQALADEPCAPYTRSDGLSLGEGAAFVVLESVSQAVTRGATVLAEVSGFGVSADAHHPTAPDPTGRGAVRAARRALHDAVIDADDISYVNGHGTGTPANDRMERKVMVGLFGASPAVPISSTKSVVGHTLGASGAVEVVASTLALSQQMLPPTANAAKDWAGDLDVVPNVGRAAPVSVVLTNNFAFGGNNVSLVLQQSTTDSQYGARPVARHAVVVTGLGPVGALGVGIDEWIGAFSAGTPGFSRYDQPESPDIMAGRAPTLDGRAYSGPSEWKRMDEISRLAVAASRLALEDAGLTRLGRERDDIGMFVGSAFGPAATTLTFFRQDVPSAVAFSKANLNSVAGKLGEVLGLRGPTTTFAGPIAGTSAFATALDLIERGVIPAAVVVAFDELAAERVRRAHLQGELAPDGVMRPYDERRAGTVLGEAAIALVLERADHADERRATHYASAMGSAMGSSSDSDRTASLELVTGRAMQRAGVDRVDYCAGRANGQQTDLQELDAVSAVLKPGVALSAPAALTGDCAAASGLLNVAAAAIALRHGVVAPTSGLRRPARVSGAVHIADAGECVSADVALAVDAGGSGVSAVVLGRVGG